MAEKANNKRHKSTIDKYFERTAKAYTNGSRKTMKKETICRLRLRQLEIRTKMEIKDSIFTSLTPAEPTSSQVDLCNQCREINSFASLSLEQRKCIIPQILK